jgi:hypothetical protein
MYIDIQEFELAEHTAARSRSLTVENLDIQCVTNVTTNPQINLNSWYDYCQANSYWSTYATVSVASAPLDQPSTSVTVAMAVDVATATSGNMVECFIAAACAASTGHDSVSADAGSGGASVDAFAATQYTPKPS